MRLKYTKYVLRLIEKNAHDHSIVLKSCSQKFIIIKLNKNNHIVQDNFYVRSRNMKLNM